MTFKPWMWATIGAVIALAAGPFLVHMGAIETIVFTSVTWLFVYQAAVRTGGKQ